MRRTPAAYQDRSLLMRLGPYLIGCWVACGCEEGTLHASAPPAAARPGPLDTSNRYVATVRVYSQELAKVHEEPPACSGTVIGPRLVLTAAHCVCKKRRLVSKAQAMKGRTVTAIITASDCANRAEVVTVRYPKAGPVSVPSTKGYAGKVQPHLHAELLFEEDVAISVNADLAVIFLTEEVEGIAPVSLTDAEVKEEDPIMMVGYGMSERTAPERRAGESRVSKIREPVPGSVEFSANLEQLEDGGAASLLISGDSGGGCFKLGDPPVLIGVNAAGSRNIWDQASSTFTSVFAFKDWVELQINDPRAAGIAPDLGRAVRGVPPTPERAHKHRP